MPRNPLDVLAQQIVAMTAMDDWEVGELERRRPPRGAVRGLTRPVLDAVLDMLAGRYPSEDFGGLRPRLVWDRAAGIAARAARRPARRGRQRRHHPRPRPVRGVPGRRSAGPSGRHARRVGELDEEMVYESRVGDVFVLGASSWRIEDITADQVLVSPAPGQPGKLPFWHGDTLGRPAELGAAIGALLPRAGRGAGGGGHDPAARRRPGRAGRQQPDLLPRLAARGDRVPPRRPHAGRRAVPRRAGRLAGGPAQPATARQVHAPWALAIAGRLRERYGGMDVQAIHTDDGIVIRVPDTDDPPPGSIALLDPDEVEQLVTAELGVLGPVRVPVPRVRGPGAAAAPPPAGPPDAAVAAAAARGPAAVGGQPVRDVPDRAGNGPGVPAGRVRRARPDRADARPDRAPHPAGRGRDADGLAVRPVPAVPVRRRLHVRGRRAAGRAPGARPWPWTRRCWPTCSARPTCASCSTRWWSRKSSGSCSGWPRAGPAGTPRPSPTCSACWGRSRRPR